ncbi:MAG: hypothetical protein JWO77_653, partial [Ilumatobacteraceae bacterium]|nr:hypothetical protein [Ilumatobacteraceae bacterium]
REPDPAPRSLLVVALVAGVALELGLRGGLANLLVALGLSAVVVGLAAHQRLRQRSARAVALLALVPLAFLAVRASAWLVATNLVAAGVLVATAIAFSRSGRPSDTTVGGLGRRLAAAVPAAWSAPRVLAPLVPSLRADRSARLVRIGVALAICVPVLAVVAALLAAADPVFAGLLAPDIDPGPALGHLILVAVIGIVAVCVIGAAASDTEDRAPAGRFGALEVVTMLTVTAAVLGLFVISQLIALTSAGQRLVERSGLTPAEYARSGFFQLCWATGLILSLLAAIRALATPAVRRSPAVRALGALVPVLALGLVAVSLRRMALYDDAFGLTMLRLWVLGAAAWMGVVLILVAVRNAGVGVRREWVLAASATAGLVLVLAADVANPEALVARHNLARADRGAELDLAYLSGLSDDAVPVVAAAWDEAGPAGRIALEPALRCDDAPGGARSLNLDVRRAEAIRAGRCDADGQP